MNDTKVAPALTAEEWAARRYFRPHRADFTRDGVGGPGLTIGGDEDETYSVHHEPDELHALAALTLHEQPFGFTRNDVAMLRDLAADEARIQATGRGVEPDHDLTALADRIEALLPPAP